MVYLFCINPIFRILNQTRFFIIFIKIFTLKAYKVKLVNISK